MPNATINDIIRLKRTNATITTASKSCSALSCRIQGESLFFYNGRSVTVNRGDILWIPRGASYSQKSQKEEVIVFHIDADNLLENKISVFRPKDPNAICDLFVRAYSLWTQKKPNFVFSALSVMFEILAQSDFNTPTKDDCPPIIQPSVDYLNAHFDDPDLKLSEVCKQSFISGTYFNRIFNSYFGCSPLVYVNRLRIRKAKQLLGSCYYTREEVAALSGFNNVKYFYTLFKKSTGLTTAEYIKSLSDYAAPQKLT